MGKIRRYLQWTGNILFVVYLIVLAYLLFFSEGYGRVGTEREYRYNLILFKEITRCIRYYEQLGIWNAAMNLVGNIVVFIPYGFWLPVMNRACAGFWKIFLWTFGFSLAVETIQLITKTGAFDVDDLLLNTVGGLTGFWFYQIGTKIRARRAKQ